MASDEEEGDIFDVERILAEKVNNENVHFYLVKWDGYPDEECTWEPAESFTDPDALREWAAQKARGDTLDAYDLQQIQDQMDAFTAIQGAGAESDHEEDNPPSPASATGMDEPQEKPRKRPKLVPDAPLLTKRVTARPNKSTNSQRQVSKLSKTPSTSGRSTSPQALRQRPSKSRMKPAVPALYRSSNCTKSIVQRALAPLHGLSRASVPSKAATSTYRAPMATQSAITGTAPVETPQERPIAEPVHDEPQKLSGPEMCIRVHAEIAEKRDNTGNRFNKYQHINNAWKKMKEDRPPPFPQSKTTAVGEQSEKQISERAQSPLPQNASWLFFEDYEDEGSRQKALEQNAAISAAVHNEQEIVLQGRIPAGSDQLLPAAVQPDKMPLDRADPEQNPAPISQRTQTDNATPRAYEATTAFSGSSAVRSTRLQEPSVITPVSASLATSQAQRLVVKPLAKTNTTTPVDYPGVFGPTTALPQTDDPPVEEGETRPCSRRNSLFNRSLLFSSVADNRRDAPPRSRSPQREPLTIEARSGMPTVDAQNFISYEEVVTAKNGRDGQKGDIILDLLMDNREAGVVKLLHVPWHLAKPIVALKQGAQLRIGFSYALSRLQYENLVKDRWFSYFAIGTVESFYDTAYGVASLAKYLEDCDIAGLWDHPEEDITLVLYSSRSRSWHDLGQKPVRQGESRLHIAFRQKLRELGPSMETLAQIMEHGKLIEEVGEVRGRETQRRAQNMEQRDASQRKRSSSGSRRETADLQRAVRKARNTPRPRTDDSDGHERREDVDGGQTSRRASIASTTLIPPDTQPISTLPSRAIQSPCVQLLQVLQTTMSPQYDADISENTMDINLHSPAIPGSRRSRTSTINTTSVAPLTATTAAGSAIKTIAKPTTITTAQKSFAGLDRDLKDISWSPDLKADKAPIFVMLAYKKIEPNRIQQLQSWLVEAGVPPSHVFDKSISGHWADFSRRIENSVCVVLFDKRYPLLILDSLAKLLEQDKLLCWELDYQARADTPLPMTRLFPHGIVIAISEGCFVHEPNATLKVLKWFKAKATKPYSCSKLMTPPCLGIVLQDQAMLAKKESSKNQYLDLAKLLSEMADMNDSITDASDNGIGEANSLHFSVVQLTWSEVYKNTPQSDEKLSALESKERDEEKDSQLLQYFGAWAFRHLKDHRRFIAFTINDKMGNKPKNVEHVRLQLIRGFAEKLDRCMMKEREATRHQGRARSRDRVHSASATSTPGS